MLDSLIDQVSGGKQTRQNYTKSGKANLRRELVTESVLQGKTEDQIAGELGMSRGRVAQIKAESGFQERIAARIAEAQINTDEILGVLHSHLHASIEDFFEFTDDGQVRVNLKLAQERGVLHLLKELSYDQWGKPKIKIHDSKAAADTLARIKGLDKSGQQGGTLTIGQIKFILKKTK